MSTPAKARPRLIGSTARTANGASSSRATTARPSFMPGPAPLARPSAHRTPRTAQRAFPVPACGAALFVLVRPSPDARECHLC